MKTDELNNNHLIADEGKVLRRLSDGWIAGKEIVLGYTYFLNNIQLPEPLLELPEHYEEIDEPQTGKTVLLDENIIMEEESIEVTPLSFEDEIEAPVKLLPKRRITIDDYLALEEKVNQLLNSK